jgi:ParB/RepB/Spo0J family partition protein
MAIKGRHNRIATENVPDKLMREIAARATRRDLFSARSGASNWVLAYVQPERIDPNPNQPRRQIERSALEELKQSIAERGILQPLLGARGNDGRVRLIAGHRRLQASKELGLARVPVVLVDHVNEEETVIDAVIENIQRRNLEAWEEGVAYAQLANEFGWTHDEIGKKIGKSRAYVSTRVRAAEKLSPLVKEVLVTGDWQPLQNGTRVPASDEIHNQTVEETTALLNSVDVIRRLTTLGFAEQEALLANIGQRLNSAQKLTVKDVVELIRTGRAGDAPKQLSFVDLGLDELDLYHQWGSENRAERSQKLSLDELDKLIELYERDLSKLRRLRTDKKV